jgi:hypothetical protein
MNKVCNNTKPLGDNTLFTTILPLFEILFKNMVKYTHLWMRIHIQPLDSNCTQVKFFDQTFNQNQTREDMK